MCQIPPPAHLFLAKSAKKTKKKIFTTKTPQCNKEYHFYIYYTRQAENTEKIIFIDLKHQIPTQKLDTDKH